MMANKPFKKHKKFELNQPLRNSFKIFMENRPTPPFNRYDPYRKYDAAVIDKREENGERLNMPYVNAKGIKVAVNSKMHSVSNKSNLQSPSSVSITHTNTFEETKFPEEDYDFLAFYGPYSFSDMKSFIRKYRMTPEHLHGSYKYECFQLNCSSGNIFDNISKTIPTVESESISDIYSSCLHLSKKYFDKLDPIKPNVKASDSLQYDPAVDDLPNYSELTELELSLMQKISCGCKSLTWDEFEKLYLIETKSETKHFDNFPDEIMAEDPLSLDNPKCTIQERERVYKRKIVIRDCKLHCHKRNEQNYHSSFTKGDEAGEPNTKKQHLTQCEEDPLQLSHPPTEEMVDGKDCVKYISMEKEFTMSEQVLPPEYTEVVGISKAEADHLKERLNKLRLNALSNILLPTDQESDDCATSLSTATAANKAEIQLQGVTISEEEFSTNDLIHLRKETSSSSSSSESGSIAFTSPASSKYLASNFTNQYVTIKPPSQNTREFSISNVSSLPPNDSHHLLVDKSSSEVLQKQRQAVPVDEAVVDMVPLSSSSVGPGVIYGPSKPISVSSSNVQPSIPVIQFVANDNCEDSLSLVTNSGLDCNVSSSLNTQKPSISNEQSGVNVSNKISSAQDGTVTKSSTVDLLSVPNAADAASSPPQDDNVTVLNLEKARILSTEELNSLSNCGEINNIVNDSTLENVTFISIPIAMNADNINKEVPSNNSNNCTTQLPYSSPTDFLNNFNPQDTSIASPENPECYS